MTLISSSTPRPSVPLPQGLPGADPRSTCPRSVAHPWMLHRWDRLTFLHWRYDPDVVQRLLPPGLTVETFDGAAWVGLVPFVMQVRAPGVPRIPWLSDFPETNVRTYATASNGETGVWFLSLDAARLPAVAAGRFGYQLPYMWSRMQVVEGAGTIAYGCGRRWPGPVGADSTVHVRIGERLTPDELGDLDHWLTARWTLFSHHPRRRGGGRIDLARAEHPPWELHRAQVSALDDHLLEAAGLPAPVGEPLVHWSPGTEVRISRPYRM